MAWTTPTTRSTGYVVLASDWNTDIVNNLLYLHGDAGPVNLAAGAQTYTLTAVLLNGLGAGNAALQAQVTGDTQPRGQITAGGVMSFGPGGSTAVDTILSRSAAGAMKTSNVTRQVRATPTYSTSITPNALDGEFQQITVTNATAFTINNPTNPPSASETQFLTIEVFNNSGGAMGAITWGSLYVPQTTGALINWNNPATTKHRSATFRWNSTQWVNVQASVSTDY